jgi:prevent-host-death family protein
MVMRPSHTSHKGGKRRGEWALHEAKSRFSEVCERAVNDGPQRVTRRGKESIVVVAETDFDKLSRKRKPFSEFLSDPRLRDIDLDLRANDFGRDVDL